jgi:hypothetical protein
MYLGAALLGALAIASCSDEYAYVPVVNSNALVAGIPALDYPIPPGAPVGDIRLATLGVVEVNPSVTPDDSAKAVHLRMIATNRGAETWTIDTREQRLGLPGAIQIHACNVFGGALASVVHVGPGSAKTLDLFFLLPQTFQIGATRPEFEVLWTVHTPTQTIEQRTSFDRQTSDALYEDNEDVSGWWGGSSSPSR